MPRIASGSVVRPDLAAYATEYSLGEMGAGFIADRVLPVFDSNVQNGTYYNIDIENLLEVPEVIRAPSGDYPRGDWVYEAKTFNCKEYGWEERVDDSEAAVFADYGSAEEVSTLRAVSILRRRRELRAKSLLFNTSTFSVHNVTNEWDDATNATPRADVITGVKALRAATGMTPNVLVLGWTVFQNLLVTAEFKDWVKYTNAVVLEDMEVQRALLARYLTVGEVLVGDVSYNSANKGLSASVTDVWGTEYGMLARVASAGSRDLKEPCLGRTFLWTGDSPDLYTAETYYEDRTRSNIIRLRHNLVETLVYTGAGYLLGNLTT